MIKNILASWVPHREQNVYERRLKGVMRHLKIEDYNFNWDRSSCYIDFNYQGNSYRLDHSIEKAKKKGIFLKNGLDCLMELTESLEDLCRILNRGTNDFETWISGMKQSTSEQEIRQYQEEFEIRYKSVGKHDHPEYNREEFIPLTSESPLEGAGHNYHNRILRQRQRGPLI